MCEAHQWTFAWAPVEKLEYCQSQMTSVPSLKSYPYFNSPSRRSDLRSEARTVPGEFS